MQTIYDFMLINESLIPDLHPERDEIFTPSTAGEYHLSWIIDNANDLHGMFFYARESDNVKYTVRVSGNILSFNSWDEYRFSSDWIKNVESRIKSTWGNCTHNDIGSIINFMWL